MEAGTQVEYWSATVGAWILATVLQLSPSGAISLNVKPHMWIERQAQLSVIRTPVDCDQNAFQCPICLDPGSKLSEVSSCGGCLKRFHVSRLSVAAVSDSRCPPCQMDLADIGFLCKTAGACELVRPESARPATSGDDDAAAASDEGPSDAPVELNDSATVDAETTAVMQELDDDQDEHAGQAQLHPGLVDVLDDSTSVVARLNSGGAAAPQIAPWMCGAPVPIWRTSTSGEGPSRRSPFQVSDIRRLTFVQLFYRIQIFVVDLHRNESL